MRTHADWVVVDNLAVGVDSASTNARVFAMVVYASSVRRTILVENTFGVASEIRISVVKRFADAADSTACFFADGVGAAAGCIAGVGPNVCN